MGANVRDFDPLAAAQAFGIAGIAVQLDHMAVRHNTNLFEGSLMQGIDILGDDMADPALPHQFSHGPVAVIGLHRVPGVFHFEAPLPRHAPRIGIGNIILKFHRHHLGPDAARRAEIRNAGFGGHAGAGEDHRAPALTQQIGQRGNDIHQCGAGGLPAMDGILPLNGLTEPQSALTQ